VTQAIFLSYSHRDTESATNLYNKLTQAGHSVWFDKESLLPGQDWEYEIRRAIDEAKAVLICLSSNWVNKRGYVQKELKLALEVMKEIPEGQIYTIPVRLDDCTLPPALAKLQWVDLFESNGLERLQRALESYLAHDPRTHNSVKATEINAYSEFIEDAIAKGGIIHRDPWEEGKTTVELAFKKLLKGRWNKSLELLNAQQYQEMIYLWAPLDGHPYFRIDHEEWRDKPYFRCQIHRAKSDLFIAHAQLGAQNLETHVPAAVRLLSEVLEANPYSMKGGDPDRLPTEHAENQNLAYQDTLNFAIKWIHEWGLDIGGMFDISESEFARLQRRARERLYEIELLLKMRDGRGVTK
jgi:hypothetical protein